MLVVDNANYVFSSNGKAVANVKSEEVVLFVTQDCFGGQIKDETQLIHEIDLNKANPTAGPVYVEGAEVGDVIVADILDIKVGDKGFACSVPESGPLNDVSEIRTKIIDIKDDTAYYNDIKWKIDPMVGVIGTAPAEGEIPCGLAGNHGGNMDSKLIRKGSRVYLPVRVEGGLFQLGDLHATMGDGEVSGTGIEICGEVLVRLSLIKNFELNWPVTETDDMWYVNSTDPEYGKALTEASKELMRLMKPVYDWDETDIFIYLSLQGDVGVNQGVYPIHTPMFTLRFGIPKVVGKKALIE
ncbi:MAG: acetamidase [Tissierellia bacterium]|nr:acetamidase [Tissierellia bacterium]